MEPFEKASQARKLFLELFKAPDYETIFSTFTDLSWQILVNDSTAGLTVAFTPNVDETGNELVLADAENSGYRRTGVYFNSDVYGECCDHCDKLNEFFFGYTKEQSQKLVSKSMFS